MKITVSGTGCIDLVAGICLSKTGNEIICLDLDTPNIDMLQSGQGSGNFIGRN